MDQRFLDQNRFFFLNTNYTHTHFIRNPNRFECICMCVCVGKVSTRFRHTATQFPRGWDLRPVPKFGGYNGMDDSVFVCVCWTSLSDPQSLALHQSLGVDFFIFAYICREEREKSLGSVGPPKIPNIPGMWVAKFFKDRRKFEFEISNGSPVTHQRATQKCSHGGEMESPQCHMIPQPILSAAAIHFFFVAVDFICLAYRCMGTMWMITHIHQWTPVGCILDHTSIYSLSFGKSKRPWKGTEASNKHIGYFFLIKENLQTAQDNNKNIQIGHLQGYIWYCCLPQ